MEYVENIIDNINKTHYSPETAKENIQDRKKYITVEDAIADLSYLKPGEGSEKDLHNVIKWNEYLSKIRSKKDFKLTKMYLLIILTFFMSNYLAKTIKKL